MTTFEAVCLGVAFILAILLFGYCVRHVECARPDDYYPFMRECLAHQPHEVCEDNATRLGINYECISK